MVITLATLFIALLHSALGIFRFVHFHPQKTPYLTFCYYFFTYTCMFLNFAGEETITEDEEYNKVNFDKVPSLKTVFQKDGTYAMGIISF